MKEYDSQSRTLFLAVQNTPKLAEIRIKSMMSGDSKDLSQLFLQAVELGNESERSEFVEKWCDGDTELREQLELLLAAYAKAGSFLDTPVGPLPATQAHLNRPADSSVPVGELAEAPHAKSILQLIGEFAATELPHVVLDSSPDEGPTPIVRPGSSELPKNEPDGRYKLLGEIARGGMGAIIKGHDTDLGRDLAVKVLLEEHRDKPTVIQRFVEEAQIGGQLQHPGIAPVYELGQFRDQRPFFTMKLIKGKTLSAELSARTSLTHDRARFLGIFEQVCRTMAYAHARGVIHRDLKPSNVMVGAFGEVQVMDWGLAKVLSDGGVADEKRANDNRTSMSIIQTIRSLGSDTPGHSFGSSGSQTEMGSVMGTPAYMSPEQALGEIDRLDQRSDVFGLGAILCEILTGHPPYTGDTPLEIFRKASRAKLEACYERLDQYEVDSELRQIVRDSLEPEPDERIRDAGQLSDRIAQHLESVENRLLEAELARVKANTQAEEERKRRKVWLALAGLALVTLTGGSGAWLWVQQKEAAVAQAKSEQELAALAERSRIERLINGELSSALAFVDSPSGELPNGGSLQRGLDTITRGLKLLEDHDVEQTLASEVRSAHARITSMQSNAHLVEALEQIWETEMAGFAARNEKFDASTEGDDPSARYEQAFAKWMAAGRDSLKLDRQFAQRVMSLPEAQRHVVIVSLDRWRQRLAGPKSIGQWTRNEWTNLEAIEMHSRGGDTLELKPDASILASGKNAYAGYDLTFETDMTEISALRLEALPDESLPHGGPGRREYYGDFHIEGLEVRWATRNEPDKWTRATFRNATCDRQSDTYPQTTERWSTINLHTKREGNAVADTAVYEFERPLQSASGFRFTISHQDRPRMHLETANLGRFRWSATSHHDTERIEQLQNLVESLDQDPWRRAMRREMARRDVNALIRRAEDTSILESQPHIVVIQLAEWLRGVTGLELASSLPKDIQWEVLHPEELFSHGSAILTPRDDGSILETGLNPDWDTVTVRAPAGNTPITAIRLEIIPDQTLTDSQLKWTSRQGGGPRIFELTATIVSPDGSQRQRLDPRLAFASYPWPFSLGAMFDGGPPTKTHFPEPNERVEVVIILDAYTAETDGNLEIRIMQGANFENMACFRLSVARDAIDIPAPTQTAAELLSNLVQKRPDDFGARVALAEALIERLPPRREDALRHATAAVSLRSNSARAHVALCRALPVAQARIHNPVGKSLVHHINCVKRLDPTSGWIDRMSGHMKSSGWGHYRRGNIDDAIAQYRVSQALAPDSPRVLGLIGMAYARRGDYDSAVEMFREAQELQPGYSDFDVDLTVVLNRLGRIDEALDVWRQNIERDPTNATYHNNYAVECSRYGLYEDAVREYQTAIDLGTRSPTIYNNLAIDFRRQGLIQDAVASYRQAIKQLPQHPWAYGDLFTLLSGKQRFAEAIDVLSEAADSRPNDADAHVKLSYYLLKLDPSVVDVERAVKTAKRAVEQNDQSSSNWLALGMAHYYAGNYSETVDALARAETTEARDQARHDYYPSRMRRSRIASYLAMALHHLGDSKSADYLRTAETYAAPLTFSSHVDREHLSDGYLRAIDAVQEAQGVLNVDRAPSSEERVAEMVGAYERIVAEHPTDSNARAELARLYAWYGDSEKHLALSRENVALFDSRDGFAAERFTKSLLCLPCLDGKLLDTVRRIMRDAIDNTSDFARLYNFAASGIAEYRAGNYGEAERLLDIPIERWSDFNASTYARLFRCMARFQQGRVAEARADFELSRFTAEPIPPRTECALKPKFGDDLSMWMAYEEAAKLLGIGDDENWYDTIEVYETIVADTSLNASNPRRLNELRLGALLAWRGHDEKRADLCRRLFGHYSPSMGPLAAPNYAKIALCRPLHHDDLIRDATNLAHRALELNSRAPSEWVLLSAGMADYRLGAFEQAVDHLTRAIERFTSPDHARMRGHHETAKKPGAATAQLYRAMAYHHLGRREEAEADLEAAKAVAEPIGSREDKKLHVDFKDDLIMWLALEEATELLEN